MRGKKKNNHNLVVIVVLLALSILVYFLFPKPPVSIKSFDKRAVWLSYEDLSSLSYHSKEEFQKDFNHVIETISKYQINTVIVQVRPFADALYDSKLFPVSQVITHRSSLDFDPLKEMIDLAHKQDIMIEAWLNPYRICLNEQTYQQFMKTSKASWLKDKNLTIQYNEYGYIFNPASQQVRDYVVDGVREIVKNYDVDGIHFDDYFYVNGTHKNTTKEERLDYVNILIQDVYYSIKNIKKDVTFGISPQGNYENCMNEGADVETWLKEDGYVDYIMPQIYWSDQYGKDGQTTMFSDRSKLYAKLERHSKVKLYAGLALYHAGKDLDNDLGWSMSSDNISKQIQILHDYGYTGYCLFRYSYLQKEAGQKEIDELLKVHP